MPAYKDEKQNTWYCQFYYEDWQGNRKKKKKRGFKTKKEAMEWESSFKLSANANMNMTLGAFVEIYFRDKEGEFKERTIKNKRYMLEAHVIPYFGNKPMNSITPSDIIQWQNEIRAKAFKPTYLRMIQNQLTALFTHASKIYNLANNPCKKVKRMGKSEADKLDFWTKEEYDEFISSIEVGSRYYVIFELLFWTGARSGEMLALSKSDIDFKHNRISISKTYYRTGKKDIITTPKTEQSVRVIDIPEFLTEELKEYVDKLYGLPDDARIFPIVEEAVQHKLKRQCEKTGVKKIRVHDIRHSHVAYLINQGIQPLIIKERLGHKDIKITLNTYGHLYPNQQREVADMLNQQRNKKSPDSGNCQDLG
jgi:integrase